MSGIDRFGKHVDDLARVSRAELVEWIDGLALQLNRRKREGCVETFERRRAELTARYESDLQTLTDAFTTAPGDVARMERQLERWQEELATKQEVKRECVSATQAAHKAALVATLIARITQGGPDALKAAEELKGMI